MDSDPTKINGNNELEADNRSNEPILDSLGLELSPELTEMVLALRTALMDTEFDPEALRQLWIEYSLQFRALAEQADDPEVYTKIQIGAILHKAFIFRDTGHELRYLEELDSADIYAFNVGFDELSSVLSAEIDSKTAKLEPSPERLILQLRGKVSDDNRAYLWDLWAEEQDYDDLVNHVYETLLEDGEDPEEVLRELGVLEP